MLKFKVKLTTLFLVLTLSLSIGIFIQLNTQITMDISNISITDQNLSSNAVVITWDNVDILINNRTTGFQGDPKDVCRSDGSFIVVWMDFYTQADVYGCIFDKNGNNITHHFIVNGNTTDDQSTPDVCLLSNDGFVVVWDHDLGSGLKDIYAKVFDSTGTNTTGDIL